MAGKEGESYLDQLLNNASTSSQEAGVEQAKENARKAELDNVGLQEALAVLNDLPDETGIPAKADPKEELEDLKNLYEEFGNEVIPDEAPQPEPEPEEKMKREEQEPEEPVQSLVDPEKVEEEPEQSEEVQPEGFDEPEEPKMPEEEQEPAFEDMEAMLDLLQQPDEEVEKEKQDTTEVPQETKEPEPEVSREPVAVDDIFQDALSAVGYSGDEEDLEQKLNMSSETQNENQDSQFDDILALDDIMQNESGVEEEPAEEGVQSVPVRKQKKEKKKKTSLWKRLFGNVITDETAALEEKEREEEEEVFLKKQAALIEKKKQSEADKEEKEKKNQKDKERKQQIKAEKEAQKAEKKAEKKRLKEEQAAMAETEVVGKINPIGATIVFILFATFGVLIMVGVWLLPRRANIKEAANEYANEKYIDAYQTISAVSIKEDEQALYDKIALCSKLERQIQSYQTNVSMNKKLEALHALLQGLDLYNKKQDEVKALKIQKEFLQMKMQIITYLAQDYSLDEAQANEINAITDEAEYTHRLQDIVTAAK
ncbi:MAG: hypothetical protein ACLSTL_06690 [Eubacterium sp.]